MKTEYSVVAYWPGDFDDNGLRNWAENLRSQLLAPEVSLGLVFMSPNFFPHAAQALEVLRVHAKIPLLAGCSSHGLIAGEEELEKSSGLVLALYSLPGATVKGVHFSQSQVTEAVQEENYWPVELGVDPRRINGWLAFVDPFHMDSESWIRSWNRSFTGIPVFGGLSSGTFPEPLTQIYLNGEVYEEGGVGIAIGGEVELTGVISQGCTPIGETWTLTRVEQNIIHNIGNRPAYAVLAETFQKLPPEEQRKAQGNLFIGLVVNEYLDEFHRGDFLVRNLIGGDPKLGLLAVGAMPRTGQTMQFQRRDADAATEDMNELLGHSKKKLAGVTVYGGCLCCCNGRGQHLFGRANHDVELIQHSLGPLGLAGFFCNGEIGPVGSKNYLHGFTASLALFVKKTVPPPPAQ